MATQPRDWQGWGGQSASNQPQLSWLSWTYQEVPPLLTVCTPSHRSSPSTPLHFSSLAAIPHVPSGSLGLVLRKAGHEAGHSFSAVAFGWMLRYLYLPACSVLSAINTITKKQRGEERKGSPLADTVQFITKGVKARTLKARSSRSSKQRPLRSATPHSLAPSGLLRYLFYTAQAHLPWAGITHRELNSPRSVSHQETASQIYIYIYMPIGQSDRASSSVQGLDHRVTGMLSHEPAPPWFPPL